MISNDCSQFQLPKMNCTQKHFVRLKIPPPLFDTFVREEFFFVYAEVAALHSTVHYSDDDIDCAADPDHNYNCSRPGF